MAILDADREGFLRSQTSLIQVSGRAARNVDGQVVMYADTITGSMRRAMEETRRRREKQLEYNRKHSITPRSIERAIEEKISAGVEAASIVKSVVKESPDSGDKTEGYARANDLEEEMLRAAENLDFERAAFLRDKLAGVKKGKKWKSRTKK